MSDLSIFISHIIENENVWPEELIHYQPIDIIGIGGYGSVYRSICTFNLRLCALKKTPLEGISEIYCNREITAMLNLKHQNIVQMYSVFNYGPYKWLAMELMEDNLAKAIDRRFSQGKYFSEETIIHVIKSVTNAIYYMTAKGIVHRDIKPENILIGCKGEIKVCDFGLAGFYNNELLPDDQEKRIGTCPYMSPEIYLETTYDCTADVWSLGMTILEMANLAIPVEYHPDLFTGMNDFMFSEIDKLTNRYSEKITNFLYETLRTDSEYRMTIFDIIEMPVMKERVNQSFVKIELFNEV